MGITVYTPKISKDMCEQAIIDLAEKVMGDEITSVENCNFVIREMIAALRASAAHRAAEHLGESLVRPPSDLRGK